ncbi:MAG: GatB/YqeY domain-containing protein [Pseudomonadota bacterium]
MRDRITAAMKDAMRAKDQLRLSTLRLMSAALKDQDIAKRAEEGDQPLSDAEIVVLLSKMVKQREDSAKAYEEAGRMELVEQERAEQAVIREFLPKPLSEAEVEAAVANAIKTTGASSIRDMGKVMGALKAAHAGRMDFGSVGPKVKAALC